MNIKPLAVPELGVATVEDYFALEDIVAEDSPFNPELSRREEEFCRQVLLGGAPT